jgi:signal transduction histidine kinase/CheY-like chemotaxis protein
MNSESIEACFSQLQADYALVLDQVDEAIARFDSRHRLILFNQKFAQTWNLAPVWLQENPSLDDLLTKVASQGCLSNQQQEELLQALQFNKAATALNLIQLDGVALSLEMTPTADGGQFLILRNITHQQQIQATLNAEVKRLTFLLGLTERLQTSEDLYEIGRFTLHYLVQTMAAAFGDIKVIRGCELDCYAIPLMNEISAEFIATFGQPVAEEMQAVLDKGIPYRQGLLWDVVETGQPLFIQDYASQPKSVPGFRHPAIGQLGIFPIPSADGTIIGVLTIESRNLERLQDAPQQDMLLAACRMLGAAIERIKSQEHLKQANQDLERASQLKSNFLAAMSHELRTPLSSILGFSSLLQDQFQGALNDKQLQYISLIYESGQHLLELINDILDLSKIEAGKEELNIKPILIQDLFSQCLEMIQPRAERKRISLTLELDYQLNQVALDERRVRQILINLLSNAVKFTPEGGSVKLSGRLAYGSQLMQDARPDKSPVNASTPYLRLEVKDSGIGIPIDKHRLLFQPFQQIDSSLARKYEGTGLGLALTKRLSELHGGTVSFESSEGQGSSFRVWLPLTELRQQLAPEAETIDFLSSAPSPDPLLIAKKRILVVEDQVHNQVLLADVLEAEGYNVELIADGGVMLERLRSNLPASYCLPALILMDIQLPHVSGIELIRYIKAHPRWQTIPVIAVTAMAMAGDRDLCLQAGADAYLSKPLKLQQLLEFIRSLEL